MKLKIDRLDGYDFSTEIVGLHSADVSKKIVVKFVIEAGEMESNFVVISKRTEVLSTSSLAIAVDMFNSI